MSNIKLSALENKAINYDFSGLSAKADAAGTKIASAETAADVKTEICKIWGEVRPFLIWGKAIPVIGQYITILFNLLDPICGVS